MVNRLKVLGEQEVPVANIAAMQANYKRDPKKKTKPYSFKDFMFYKNKEDTAEPSARYGSAAVALAKQGKMPRWALFCFAELNSSADPGIMPETLAFIAEDAMLLAPIKTNGGWTGLLIALESASDKSRVFRDERGNEYRLTVPYVGTKIIAEEGLILF